MENYRKIKCCINCSNMLSIHEYDENPLYICVLNVDKSRVYNLYDKEYDEFKALIESGEISYVEEDCICNNYEKE